MTEFVRAIETWPQAIVAASIVLVVGAVIFVAIRNFFGAGDWP